MTKRRSWRECLSDGVFRLGVALCCVLLMPVCALMWCVYGVFAGADWLSGRLRHAREDARDDGAEDAAYVIEDVERYDE